MRSPRCRSGKKRETSVQKAHVIYAKEGEKMKLGELQTLKVEKIVPFGVYLTGEDPEEGRVLLPRSQVPEGTNEGDELEVFLY